MKGIFLHMGTRIPDYRGIMKKQKDIILKGRNIPINNVVICEQTHSNMVHLCSVEDNGAGVKDHPQIAVADGLVTNICNQYLLIRTADCFPVMFFDEYQKVVAGVHSGREGTRKNIVGEAVKVMVEHYGCKPENIVAHIGAGICEQHYEVSELLWDEFNQNLEQMDLCPCNKQYRHLNLRATIHQQLIQAKLKFININNVQECTYENKDYFSYRKEKGNNRQINIIGICNE